MVYGHCRRHLLLMTCGGVAVAGAAILGCLTVAATAQQALSGAQKLMTVRASRLPGKVHVLPATLETTQWGWFDNAELPRLTIDSGDTVVFETMSHAHGQLFPGRTIDELKKLRTDWPGRGPMTITGPVFVNGAEPGDVLQIKIRPFPGTLGVARAQPGRYNAVPPGPFAGNLDKGATLHVPVFVRGALVWTGDSHAAQGNGEVNLTAIETAFQEMNVTITVDKTHKLEWPRIETASDWITMGFDEDLAKALDSAKNETTKLLAEERGIPPERAASLLPALADCRVTQVVDIKRGVHCLLPKDPASMRPVLPRPGAENADYLVTTSRAGAMNQAVDQASWDMIELLQKAKGLSRLDAYALASITMDCRIGEIAATDKSIHCLVPKSLWTQR